ncbi:hypothetical protein A2631_02030 [Candidatus Daviesbacteria bacterium RIFCSPHIGHO2_01_FULL_44_29]|uniref:DUF5678 domain-containing protein n=1 Tax=Candidatus Daviesbacteria bacterium RIFCSPHIGHO2_02_FULL_43_12 TaxID=1797776 RepID=A0A1F5KK53_9BACT|nr:MAG: hypothetical protein A2631_02030 [Candidatus Daviesbacteria bacterium RIFCSPHIGHO2_01_FULL_44_29]OGE39549.1 MAG: hypothetical protein A3E86_01870 [Candidatus Daviesbacteria bacterium RIFCSPHIGHO2_12_FULL_47_45]OGE41175.1 MAG: hypothetical protein A3D25_01425 [Candidatus Daviesbacteria bacterium RIFCSPHIGHO2_02_FULL_43_12]OGE69374.1 MAG: hypothetical protein A3B55_03165 [Candidatus Daviesbacteria bacterium RIFCSPLOWO2_01_FULL_43_15]
MDLVRILKKVYAYSMKSDIFLPYENKWVALAPDKSTVIASGKSYKDVDNQLKKKKINDAILSYIMPFDQFYSPNGKNRS